MNRRYVKIVFLLLSVMILVALACAFVACGENDNGGETNNGGNNGGGVSVVPIEERPHTDIIITIDGQDTDTKYSVEPGQALTIRKYVRAHYTFLKYTFDAPNGLTYESDKDGQKWKTADENSFKVLNWSWETETIKIEAHFTAMSYKMRYVTGINGSDTVYDLNMEVEYGSELPGNFTVELGKVVNANRDKKSGYEIDGVGSKNKVVDLNPQVRLVDTASVLNENDYDLDDVNRECILRILWKRGSYTVEFYDHKTRYSKVGFAAVEYGVGEGKGLELSQYAYLVASNEKQQDYVLIGWEAKSYSEVPPAFESENASYTVNDKFEQDSGPSVICMYAIWGKRPDVAAYESASPTVDATHVSLDPLDNRDNVRYTYVAPGSTTEVELAGGSFSALMKNRTYTVNIYMYRVYTKDSIEADRKVCELSIRPLDAPQLSIVDDKLIVSGEASFGAIISVDGIVRGALSELAEYFLREESTGNHTVEAYASYEENGVYYRSATSSVSFTIRDAECIIEVNNTTLFLSVAESERESVISATVKIIEANSERDQDCTRSIKNGVVRIPTAGAQKFICTITFKGSGENVVSTILKKEVTWGSGNEWTVN